MAFTGADSMRQAIIIFFLCCFSAAGLALVGGLSLDTWFNAMFDVGWFEVPPEWDSSNVVSFLMRLFYFGCIAICIYGIVVLIVTIYHKYVLDEDEDDDDEDEIGSSTYIGGNI